MKGICREVTQKATGAMFYIAKVMKLWVFCWFGNTQFSKEITWKAKEYVLSLFYSACWYLDCTASYDRMIDK